MNDLGEAFAWIAACEESWRQESNASWAVIASDDDRPLGQVGLRKVSLFEAQAAISYWTIPTARGRGIAVAATTALTGWALHTIGFHRLFLTHSIKNTASCRVADKTGFQVEGTLRGWGLHADGFHDGHLHSRLRTDH